MPITMTLAYTADLALPLKKSRLHPAFLTGDELSHRFQVDICRAGEPVQLNDAAVTGYFIRPDGATVSIPGLAEDSCVTLTLPAACYRLPGRFSLVIRLMQNDVKAAVFWAEGAMTLSATDTLVDDGVIPSLDDLLAQIDAMEKATAAATEAADTVMQKLNSGELHGKGLTILGYYDTLDMLTAAVSQPAVGDAYAIGLQAPYDIYIWNGTQNQWVNNGPLQGVPGATGPQGAPGRDGASARRNLLDNSDFRNPVNQRGATSYTGSGVSKTYTIDRWATWQNVSDGIQITADGITIADGVELVQYTASECFKAGKTYTFAAMQSNGELSVLTVNYGSAAESDNITVSWEGAYEVGFSFYLKSGTYEWAALYEGEYTADTLPEYIPKGYTAELLECQRYYLKLEGSANVAYPAYTVSATQADVTIPVAVPMRITPTLTVGDVSGISVYTSTTGVNATAAVVQGRRDNAISLRVTADVSTAWRNACARFNTTVELSADL